MVVKAKKKAEEKTKFLGIRISKENMEEFDRFCLDNKLSKSDVARTAITKYLHIIYSPEKNPKMIYSKSQFNYCLGCLNADQIQTLASITYQNGQTDMNRLENYVKKKNLQNKPLNELDYEFYTLTRFVFSSEGQHWFEEVNYHWKGSDRIIFSGKHQLGNNFSLYIKELLGKYTAPYGCVIQKEVFSSELVEDKNMYQMELHFKIKKSEE